MGFLSRKSKQAEPTVVEENPIDQELQEMEEAVPEVPGSTDIPAAPSVGPVTGDDPSSSRDDAAGKGSPPVPPAAEAEEISVEKGPTDTDSLEAEGSGEGEGESDEG